MSNILVISLSNIKHDARVKRQIDFLKEDHSLTVAAFDISPENTFEFIKLTQPRLSFSNKILTAGLLVFKLFNFAYKKLYHYPQLYSIKKEFDLIIINDLETIAIANEIKGKARLLFDAHEYFPRQFEDKFAWRILFQPLNTYLCRQYLAKVDAMTTIGEGIALEYERQFHVKPVNNAAAYQSLKPTPTNDREINLVHHGIAIPSRRLELMIEMMNHLDERFYLNLMLLTPQTANAKTRAYLNWLKEISKQNPRIKFIAPVKSDDIVTTINKYDIGIILVPPVNFNYKNGLGNKFFDFIQSRLAFGIGPIPEMASIVRKYNLGIVSEDFTPVALARELNSLTKDKIDYFKQNAEVAAKEINAQNNKVIFNKIINQLLTS
jgi:hypothetical protein